MRYRLLKALKSHFYELCGEISVEELVHNRDLARSMETITKILLAAGA